MTSSAPIRLCATPSVRRTPSRAAFLSRSSMWSMSSRSAISSMSDSMANVPCGEPGARYAETFGLLTTTS